jgi:nucleoside-diphosphate-sugar epimerase
MDKLDGENSQQNSIIKFKEKHMLVLVTGGAGRLGINVDKAFLKNGYNVRVFDLDTPGNRNSIKRLKGKAEIQWGDVTNPDSVRQALAGVDAVVHMAGILPPVAYEKPELAAKVNVGGTGIIVDLLKQTGRHIPLVFTSSVAAFGPTPDVCRPLCPEQHDANPRGAYGETKLQAENIIKESGMDYAILRLTATMYLSFSMSDLKRMFTVPLDNRVEYCHPDDTASAIVNAVKNFDAVKGNILVISGGPEQRMLYRDMIKAMLGVMGLPVPPARKFTKEPYYLDWYDTTKSQKLLSFQHRSFADYIKDYSKQLSRQYGPGFIPFMRSFVSPLFGKAIVQLF